MNDNEIYHIEKESNDTEINIGGWIFDEPIEWVRKRHKDFINSVRKALLFSMIFIISSIISFLVVYLCVTKIS